MSRTVSVSGMNAMGASASASLTIPLAAPGNERIDLIVIDDTTCTISRAAGKERSARCDALEWQGNPGAGKTVIGSARVTADDVSTIETGLWRGVRCIGPDHAGDARTLRNRGILSALIAAARAGEAINLGGYGDSITALQHGWPGYAANGAQRDRAAGSYFVRYPADTRARLTLYDTGDGAGPVHTRLGWNWAIKAALEALGGSRVTYLNYGMSGTTSQHTEPVPGRGNGLYPARLAAPLGDSLDAVVIAFGINELGRGFTHDNIVEMVGRFRAVGTACIVMGCPRPNPSLDRTAWLDVNAALESAAQVAGAAFVSTTAITADGLALGGMGVPARALASANMHNHPGIWELNRYGANAVRQLGIG